MQSLRSCLRRWSWIALLAMLGIALAPTVSHALAANGPANPFTEICSVAGRLQSLPAGLAASPVDLAANPQGSPLDGAGGHPMDHCPLCSGAGGQPALPVTDPAALPVADGADFVAALFAQSPRPLFAWAAAQARAPPSSV